MSQGIHFRRSTTLKGARAALDRMENVWNVRPSKVENVTEVGFDRKGNLLYQSDKGDLVTLSYLDNSVPGIVPNKDRRGFMLTPNGNRLVHESGHSMDGVTLTDCSFPANHPVEFKQNHNDYSSKFCTSYEYGF